MPPKNPRPPGIDEWVAARVRHEREKRDWSTAELARRVSQAGVTLRQQQVWQIESGTPPRKLSVGEAAAFAKIFGISLTELMTPPEQASIDLIEIGRAFMEWQRDAGALAGRLQDIAQRIAELGESDVYDAETVEKYSGYVGVSDHVAEGLDQLAGDYHAIAESVRQHGAPWSVIASMRDLVTSFEVGSEGEPS